MAPPVYVALYQITGDVRYVDFMNKEYKVTTDSLFDAQASLYYRDIRYKTQQEKNGAKVFWARGNAWVYAGLAMILNDLPKTHPSYSYYKDLYLRMSPAVVASQDKQGSWHPSMLDLDAYPMPDNSASGLFLYGIAWGLNHQMLTGKVYEDAAQKGWKAIKSYVQEDGKLGFVQPIGSSPEIASKDLTEVYGVGAFLMAASQMILR
jgi:rhamnogalacturonyl hydrolase YesR